MNLNEKYGAMGQRAWILGSQSGPTSQKKNKHYFKKILCEKAGASLLMRKYGWHNQHNPISGWGGPFQDITKEFAPLRRNSSITH